MFWGPLALTVSEGAGQIILQYFNIDTFSNILTTILCKIYAENLVFEEQSQFLNTSLCKTLKKNHPFYHHRSSSFYNIW